MTEESNTEATKKDFHKPMTARIFSNEFDIDIKVTDMQGNTILVIPAGVTGTFVETGKEMKMKKDKDKDREKLLSRIIEILYGSFPIRYDIACETAEKILKEIEK